MPVYFFPRLAEPGKPAGITVSKSATLPAGEFGITEYTWPGAGVVLWFVDDDQFTEDEREDSYHAYVDALENCDA